MMGTTNVDNRLLHGIVLAGGEGRRLELYVQEIKGEALPKQYINVIGRRSMLEHTFHRAEKLISKEQILTVVSRRHLLCAEVCRQLASRPRETLIVQPANKETGPGILLPLMFIYKRSPQAIVAIFPSDHFVLEENRFMDHVRLAVQVAQQDPSRIVLLAMEPHEAETEYGYVVPHEGVSELCRFGTRRVSAFIEKPGAELASELVMAGGLWNTMTMVFKADTLLQLVRALYPVLYLDFWRILEALGTRQERPTIDEVYENLELVNFSNRSWRESPPTTHTQYQFFPCVGFFGATWVPATECCEFFGGSLNTKPNSFKPCLTPENLSKQKAENYRPRSMSATNKRASIIRSAHLRSGRMAKRRKMGRASLQVDHDCSARPRST
jgi:mannose-1-phosphate guanylyltransferase